MNTKTIALACAGVLAAPALAFAQSNVTISGRAWMAVENVRAKGATAGSTFDRPTLNRVTSYPSYIRFAGQEDLGNGLTAWFQVENDIQMDVGNGTWAARNTGVGLKGSFGNVLLGRWDSPYKAATSRLDPFDISGIGSYQNILGQLQTAANSADNFFDARLSNGAQYWSPTWGGFSFRLGVVGNEGRTAANNLNPNVISASAQYASGPIYLTVAHERRKDCGSVEGSACGGSLLGGQGRDRGTRVGGSYTLGSTTLSAVWERLDAESDTNDVDLKRNAVFLGVEHQFAGPHRLKAAYGRARDAKGSAAVAGDDTGAYYYTLGYDYIMSKRTNLFALYTHIENEDRAAYRFGSRGIGTVANGADSSGFSAGIKHLF